MRVIRRTLRNPVTGEINRFTLTSKEDMDAFQKTRAAWGRVELQRRSGGQDATAVQPASVVNQVQPTGQTQQVGVVPDRAIPRPTLTDEQVLRSMAPSVAAMTASSLIPPMRYGALARTGVSALAGALASPISGTDPRQEAMNQALMQVPGELLSGLTTNLGKGAMRKGISAAPELRQSFGDIGGVASRERLGVANPRTLAEGPEPAGLGEKLLGNFRRYTGSKGAEESLAKVRNNLKVVLTNDPTQHSLPQILGEVRTRLRKNIGRQPLHTEQLDQVDDILKRMQMENFSTMDNLAAWEMKTGAQNAAVDLLKKSSRPTVSSAEAAAKSDMEQLVNKELQQVLNERLRHIKGYRALATRYQELEGVRRAFLDAETGADATASARAVAGGTAPRVAFNPEGALSPQMLTGMGRTFDHPVTRWAGANLPRALQEWARLNDPTFEATDLLPGQKKPEARP